MSDGSFTISWRRAGFSARRCIPNPRRIHHRVQTGEDEQEAQTDGLLIGERIGWLDAQHLTQHVVARGSAALLDELAEVHEEFERLLHAFLCRFVDRRLAGSRAQIQNSVLPFDELVAHVEGQPEQREKHLDRKLGSHLGDEVAFAARHYGLDPVDHLRAQIGLEGLDHAGTEERLQDAPVASLVGRVECDGNQRDWTGEHVEGPLRARTRSGSLEHQFHYIAMGGCVAVLDLDGTGAFRHLVPSVVAGLRHGQVVSGNLGKCVGGQYRPRFLHDVPSVTAVTPQSLPLPSDIDNKQSNATGVPDPIKAVSPG